MNWLVGILMMLGSNEVIKQDNHDYKENTEQSETNKEPTPDMELLLFLAEWDTHEGDQWLGPEVFTEDTEFNQQLDNLKAKSDEKDSDNN